MEVIDRGGAEIAMVMGPERHLLGTVTDGDVRRAVLAGHSLDEAVEPFMNPSPTVAPLTATRAFMVALMRQRSIRQLPLLDESGRVESLALLRELEAPSPQDRCAVIMAGGQGIRLRPLTANSPKPMVKVGDRPVLETIIRQLVLHGFGKVHLAINHLGEHIRSYFESGERYGIKIEYLEETTRLGTAGALRLMEERPEGPFLVMNADILTFVNYGAILDFHHSERAAMTACVRQFDLKVPYGVMDVDHGRVVAIEEKPQKTFFINAGIYALNAAVLDLMPADGPVDMPELISRAISAGLPVASFPVTEYWIDIGNVEDLRRAAEEFPTQEALAMGGRKGPER
jgi:dTDP-glucose pyrophosphorylase